MEFKNLCGGKVYNRFLTSFIMEESYDEDLANEWIAWVEESHSETRDSEIFPFIQEWVNRVQPASLVDLGCGQGICSEYIPPSVHYIGVDASPTLIRRAQSLYPSKEFRLGSVYDIPVQSVDAAISLWVWSHLKDLNRAAKAMYDVLSPHGQCIIITASPHTYEERKTWYKEYTIQGNCLRGTFDLGNGQFLTDTTLYLHSLDAMTSALTEAGFRLTRQAKTSNRMYVVLEGRK